MALDDNAPPAEAPASAEGPRSMPSVAQAGVLESSIFSVSSGAEFVSFNPGLSGKLVVQAGAPPAAVEQYRKLAATLHLSHDDRDLRIVMVTSAVPGEGKTMTAANLAL